MVKRKGAKRRKVEKPASIEELASSLDLDDGWLKKLQEFPEGDFAKNIFDMTDRYGLTDKLIIELSSCSWDNFAGRFGLPRLMLLGQFKRVITPMYRLPQSIHERMFEAAWFMQDAYGEPRILNEDARIRALDPYFMYLIGLFHGRMVCRHEQAVKLKDNSAEFKFKYKVFTLGKTTFIIAEERFTMEKEENVAQLFFRLLVTAQANETRSYENGRIYGLLSDGDSFHFYSYHPLIKEFAFDDYLSIGTTRDSFHIEMIPVCNKIFGLLLTAYIDVLEVKILQTKEKGSGADVLSVGSAPCQPIQARGAPSEPGLSQFTSTNSGEKPMNCWEVGLHYAHQCRDKFNESVEKTDDIEVNSTAALELLTKSIRCLPRDSFSGKEDIASIGEVKDLAHRLVHEKYVNMIQSGKTVYTNY